VLVLELRQRRRAHADAGRRQPPLHVVERGHSPRVGRARVGSPRGRRIHTPRRHSLLQPSPSFP
jgi:hypothetical protein